MDMTLGDLVQGLGGTYLGPYPLLDLPYKGVSIDSRVECRGRVFVALRGDRFDGHAFAVEAWRKGSPLAVVEKEMALPCLVVPHSLEALQKLASLLLETWGPKVVAITGSSGKTTTKELIAHLLGGMYRVHKTIKNYNNLVGLPYTVANMPKETQVLVLEMGTNSPGEISRLSALAEPHVGVLTNVGRAHLGPLGGVEGVKKAKGELLKGLREDGLLVYNADDPLSRELAHDFPHTFTFGLEGGEVRGGDIRILQREECWCTSFSITGPWGKLDAILPLLGMHHVLNALAAMAVAFQLGVRPQDILHLLSRFQGVRGRMGIKRWRGVLVLDDTYNANPDSTWWALKTLVSLPAKRRLVLMGSMLELGGENSYWHRWVGEKARLLGVDWLGTLGDEAREIGGVCHFADHQEAARTLSSILREGDALLVKGSRGLQMERVLEALGVD